MNEPNSQARQTLPNIEQTLSQNNLWYDALTHLAITVGPGSFSGLRIGLSVAQAIVFAHPHIQLQCFTTLECVMAGYDGTREPVCVVIPAGKGDVYAQLYTPIGESQWHAESEIALCHPAEALQMTGSRPLIDYGNTLLMPDAAQGIWPHAAHLMRADGLFTNRKTLPLKPLYIRPPDAKLPTKSAI